MLSPPSRARPMCNAMASRVAWSRSASRGRVHDPPDELVSRFAGSPGSRQHGVRDIGHSLELPAISWADFVEFIEARQWSE